MKVTRTADAIVMTGTLPLKSGRTVDYEATISEAAVLFYVRRALANKSRRAVGGPIVAKVSQPKGTPDAP